jgi:hypothetical protein
MFINWVEKIEGYHPDVAGNMSLECTTTMIIKIIQP